jgi:hypothetical protein
MQEETAALGSIQTEAAKVGELLDEARRRLQAQLKAFPADVEDVSDEMADGDECSTPGFFVHGLLSLVLSDLKRLRQDLQEAVDASPESIRREWLRRKKSRVGIPERC